MQEWIAMLYMTPQAGATQEINACKRRSSHQCNKTLTLGWRCRGEFCVRECSRECIELFLCNSVRVVYYGIKTMDGWGYKTNEWLR